ncbi:ABC transporter permease [Fulvimonas soli]|jgi:putative ABC transport system permease protein|uniref:Putative ABC transport system permease protein n=1 Tax=Fulvimonas soli TaxID=155197 RepID=A0A316I831_9GAMM|nr:ABC transporter permease [Fulvimonas soli]PWK88708.1 putative ABC transport system permease protein [Fulvimonas soli]TNY25465.1 ABC transporter ATP-binding protein [Fulvimonas soli]
MFGYYLDLALRSLKRNKALTALMVLALALGIGATITTLTTLRVLAGDPLPGRSARLFYPQLDHGPREGYVPGQSEPDMTMAYPDAMNLVHARRATRQAAMALAQAKIVPQRANEHPYFTNGVMTTADFFALFGVPFKYGGGWTADDDERRAPLAVIAEDLNDKLFDGADSVGRTVRINDRDFRVVGVLKHWAPQPRFYTQGLGGRSYGDGDAVFLPLQSARAARMGPQDLECYSNLTDINHIETEPCEWLGVWVELDDAAAVASYKAFLDGYARQQVALGRLQRPSTALRDMMAWLRHVQVVPDDVRMQTYLAFGFLLICVVNTVGLLLAKCLRRSREIGVRRALGATRRAIFGQFMVEAAIVGLAGGVLGLLLAELGLWGVRHQPAEYASLARLDLGMFALTFAVAFVSSLLAGLLPAWRASLVAPAPQLKAA